MERSLAVERNLSTVMPSPAPLSKTLAATATASVWLLAMLALKIAIQRLMPASVTEDYPDSN